MKRPTATQSISIKESPGIFKAGQFFWRLIRKYYPLLGGVAVFALLFMQVAASTNVHAAPAPPPPGGSAPETVEDIEGGSFIATDLSGQVLDHQLYYFLAACFAKIDIDKVKEDELKDWDFFHNGFWRGSDGEKAVRGGMYDADTVKCADGQYVKEAFGRFGITDPYEAFCGLDFTYSRNNGGNGKSGSGGNNTQACLEGKGQGDYDAAGSEGAQEAGFERFIKSTSKGATAAGSLSDAAEYVRQYRTFVNGCKPTFVKPYDESGGAGGNSRAFKITVVNSEGQKQDWYVTTDGDHDDGHKVPLVATRSGGQTDITCGQLAQNIVRLAPKYVDWVKDHPGADGSQQGGAGAQTGDPGDSEVTCGIDGIGWIICPVMNFFAKLNDAAFGFLEKLLNINPDLFSDKVTKDAWSAFRDMANIAFIIAFLIIVYSQMTGVGITNYGLKKLLPKLIVAAILVNVSFYICQLAVDISNILGHNLYSLLGTSISDQATGAAAGQGANGWEKIMGAAILGTSIVLLVLAVILAPMTLIAAAMILLILIGRQAFVVLLVVISPLAFVAYLLPNTETWFRKWWKAFSITLMLFPMIGLIFGGSTLAANIVAGVGSDAGSPTSEDGGKKDGDDQQLMGLIALAIMAVPLFAVPTLTKGALGAAGSVGAKLSGLQDRANRRAGRAVKESRIGEAKTAFDASRQRRKVEQRLGKRRYFGVIPSGFNKKLDSGRLGKLTGGDRGAARATSAYNKEVAEETERQMSTMSDMNADELLKEAMNKKNSSERRAAALRKLETAGGDQHIQAAYDYLAREGAKKSEDHPDHANYDKDVGDIQQLAAAALQKRKPAGVSTSQANSLGTGTLGLKHDGTIDSAAAGGYKPMLQSRVQSGAFGAADYARMGKDDLIRLAELSQNNDLSDDDLDAMTAHFAAIESDETLKGTMTDERRALFESIMDRGGPRKANPQPGENPYHTLRPL